jgi:hypothetical protein
LVNEASLPRDVEIRAGWDAFLASAQRPAAQQRSKPSSSTGSRSAETRKIDSVATLGNWAPQARTETTAAEATTPAGNDPGLVEQRGVAIGGSSGIGLAIANAPAPKAPR